MKKKYVNVIIIGMMSLLLVGTMCAQTFVPTEADNWLGRLISKIKFSISELGTFTVAGDTLGCDKYPTSPSPIEFKKGTTKTICVSNYNVESGFINWFRGSSYDGIYSGHPGDSRQFLGEKFVSVDGINSCWSWTCDAGAYWDNDCYIDFYGCEDQPCYSNSDCASDEFCDFSVTELFIQTDGGGVCLEELPTHQTKVYSCVEGTKTYITEVSYGNVNFCTDPSDSKYLIGTTSQCLPYEPTICYEVPTDCSVYQTEYQCNKDENCEWEDADSWTLHGKCVVKTNGNGNGFDKATKSYDYDELDSLTSSQLGKSLCTDSDYCPGNSTCKIISSLINKGYITEEQMQVTRKDFCKDLGLWDRFLSSDYRDTCTKTILPGPMDKIFRTRYGFCLTDEEGEGLCSFFEKAHFFDITGDKCTDGAITMIVGIFFFIILIQKMVYGRFEYEI